jgi:citrate lyase subunit beta/citryl-CoA lyase
MNKRIAVTGNSGPKIRSDCEITIELKSKGGLNVDLESRVKVLYGKSILELSRAILNFFRISNAYVKISDSGALPFVIAARIEAAIKKLIVTDKEYLPEILNEGSYFFARDRFRFSRLYIPGNTPSLMINAGLYGADGIILDLEDSVAPDKKDEARILVRNALRQIDFRGAERMVRINQSERGLEDLWNVVPHNVNLILIPKCESEDNVHAVENEITKIRKKYGVKKDILLMPVIESALGIENVTHIARSSKNIVALAIGLEDYTSSIGVTRTEDGTESFYARSRLIVAAKAAGIQPIDSVYSDIDDVEGLKKTVKESKSLGFEGMGCIHPRQIPVISQGFAPDEEEIEKAGKIVKAYEEAKSRGLGVVALGSKMIDAPVVARAQKIIDLAVRLGKITGNRTEESHDN